MQRPVAALLPAIVAVCTAALAAWPARADVTPETWCPGSPFTCQPVQACPAVSWCEDYYPRDCDEGLWPWSWGRQNYRLERDWIKKECWTMEPEVIVFCSSCGAARLDGECCGIGETSQPSCPVQPCQ